MRYRIIYTLMVILAAVSCNKEGSGSGRSDIVPAISPAMEIVVSANGQTVETYTFDYDAKGRVTKFVRRDLLGGSDLLNLTYSYGETADMTVSGAMYGKVGNRTINVNHSSSGISYQADTWNGWLYSTSIGRNGVATGTSSSADFTSSYYSSDTDYQEKYELSGKDITKVVAGTSIKGKAVKDIFGKGNSFAPVSVSTSSALTTDYVYSDYVDRQNFCALIFACDLPVWYAEGLPGCEHLPSAVNMSVGGVTIPQSQSFEYTFKDNGDIDTVTRTWISEGKVYLTMKYVFNYKTKIE